MQIECMQLGHFGGPMSGDEGFGGVMSSDEDLGT